MTWDDFIYTLLLIISLFLGILSTKLTLINRKYFMTTVGLVFAIFVCGRSIWHSIFVTVISIIVICSKVKNYHLLVFAFTFSYLVFFRTCHFVGYARPPSYSNAIQLLLTLKLVSAAFEISDSTQRLWERQKEPEKEREEKLDLEIEYCNVEADPVDLFCYAYCFIGLLTGPYFKFRVFLDSVRTDSPSMKTRTREGAAAIDDWSFKWTIIRPRLCIALLSGLLYLVTSHFYYIQYATSDEFFEQRSVLYRWWYMTVMFFVFRTRMYFAWIVSECVFVCSHVGAYPKAAQSVSGGGPSNLAAMDAVLVDSFSGDSRDREADYRVIRNLDIWGSELSPTLRGEMRSWNTTVQFWLAHFIYRRFPLRTFRTSATMLVSAFWHGVHPGYYLSFLTIPLALAGEKSLAQLLPRNATEGGSSRHCGLVWLRALLQWFYTMRVLDTCCTGFLLLEGAATIRYWSSLGVVPHLVMLILIGAGYAHSAVTTASNHSAARSNRP